MPEPASALSHTPLWHWSLAVHDPPIGNRDWQVPLRQAKFAPQSFVVVHALPEPPPPQVPHEKAPLPTESKSPSLSAFARWQLPDWHCKLL
jgi:hypothetical protein